MNGSLSSTDMSVDIDQVRKRGVTAALYTRRGELASRALDVMGAAIGLIIGAPFMLAAAIGIRLTMGSPVLFRQRRLGRDERPFTLFKFRTMRAPEGGAGSRKSGSDSATLHPEQSRGARRLTPSERITPAGRILRQLSIDELPQLWNVLRGDMSLVGPRPLYIEYLPYYTKRERIRHRVRPGLTGLAQISGRNRAQWDDRLELDAQYVEAKSLWLDLHILTKTVAQVIRRENVMDAAIQGNLAQHRASRGGVPVPAPR